MLASTELQAGRKKNVNGHFPSRSGLKSRIVQTELVNSLND